MAKKNVHFTRIFLRGFEVVVDGLHAALMSFSSPSSMRRRRQLIDVRSETSLMMTRSLLASSFTRPFGSFIDEG